MQTASREGPGAALGDCGEALAQRCLQCKGGVGGRPSRSLSLHCLCDAEAEASLPGLQIQGVTTASVLWTAASLSVAGYVVYARSRIITGLVYGGII